MEQFCTSVVASYGKVCEAWLDRLEDGLASGTTPRSAAARTCSGGDFEYSCLVCVESCRCKQSLVSCVLCGLLKEENETEAWIIGVVTGCRCMHRSRYKTFDLCSQAYDWRLWPLSNTNSLTRDHAWLDWQDLTREFEKVKQCMRTNWYCTVSYSPCVRGMSMRQRCQHSLPQGAK